MRSRSNTRPGEEIIIEERGHVLNYELGAASLISGVTIRPVKSSDGSGHLKWNEIEPELHVYKPYWVAPTSLICLENTHNFAGGSVMSAEHCTDVCQRAHAIGLPVHMDGARIFNASAASGSSVADLSRHCDSVMFTLSKGLGAPAGSILLGTKDFITEARTWRKRLGGGMRQIGILAAAGLVALDEGPARLHEDHANSKSLAEGIAEIHGVEIDPSTVQTNIVIFDVSRTRKSATEICMGLKEAGVLAIGISERQIRMVTHLDVSRENVSTTVGLIRSVIE
jgi:threonine aldolase